MDTGRAVSGVDGSGLTLALNAAEGVLQIAVGDHTGRFIYSQQIYTASNGVEVLTPALNAAFMLLNKKPADIARVAVVRGPGSFTGLRLTAVTAAGLARTVRATQAGIDYMELLARECEPSLSAADTDTLLWVLVRARRDLVYMRAFVRDWGSSFGMRAATELEVQPVAAENAAAVRILEAARKFGCSRVLLAGSGLEDNRESLVRGLAVPGAPRVTGIEVQSASPEKLIAAALAAEYGPADIEPLYVRSSDAEENLAQIARRLGNDPKESARQLFALTHTKPESVEGV